MIELKAQQEKRSKRSLRICASYERSDGNHSKSLFHAYRFFFLREGVFLMIALSLLLFPAHSVYREGGTVALSFHFFSRFQK
jgi:hypothetical protein